MSKNKVVAICLIVFQVVVLISLAAAQRLGAILFALFFCSFGVIAVLLLALDTKNENRSTASGLLLLLFGLLILVGSIGALTQAFNGWYIAFILGAIVLMAVGGTILYQKQKDEEALNSDKQLSFLEQSEPNVTTKKPLSNQGKNARAIGISGMVMIVSVVVTSLGFVYDTKTYVWPTLSLLLLFLPSLIFFIAYIQKGRKN